MAKIKKVETATLHISNKYATGSVHPRLQKHTRQALKPNLKADQKIADQKSRERQQQLERDVYKEKQSAKEKASRQKPEEKYDFPFDEGYKKFLDNELRFSSLSAEQQKAIAENSKYQSAYEAQSGKSFRDGSALSKGVQGYSADYVSYLQGLPKFKQLSQAEQQRVADNARTQSEYTAKTGNDPKTGQPSKGGSYTRAYRQWVNKTFSPRDSAEEQRMLGDQKVQSTYTKQTGNKPTG